VNLTNLIMRGRPEPWSEGDNIPWNDPEFSQAMLKWHLDQDTDAASRRIPIIERHVSFIHTHILGGQPADLLDLGCGPGLYLERLARLGHRGVGIDFSPASIAYARQAAARAHLPCTYRLDDLRRADFSPELITASGSTPGSLGPGAYDLAMLLFGEFNVFRPADIRLILRKAWAVLKPGGSLLLEPSPEAHIRHIGQAEATWYTSPGGLFSPRPHVMLEEAFWDDASRASTVRFFCIDAASGEVKRYAASYQAYSDEDYRGLLVECGFVYIRFLPALTGDDQPAPDFFVIWAAKSEAAA